MSQPSSPTHGGSTYASGGGGVSFERSYGATLLAALLVGDPVQLLGHDLGVTRVDFQAQEFVDDYRVHGGDSSGQRARQIYIAVRRDPTLTANDEKFGKLLEDFIGAFLAHRQDTEPDSWRLGLVVAAPHGSAEELRELADLARAQADHTAFKAAVSRRAKKIRTRLEHLENAIDAAVKRRSWSDEIGDRNEFPFRFLRVLHVSAARLEGDDAPDRTASIARLRTTTKDTSAAAALFDLLVALTASFAPAGATVDQAPLRRSLMGRADCTRSSSPAAAWRYLDACEVALRERTRRQISQLRDGTPISLALPRTTLLDEVCNRVRNTGVTTGCLVIEGPPEAGKSAITLAAVDRLRSEGATAIALSLRELPGTVPEIERALQSTLSEVLAGAEIASSRALILDGGEIVHEAGKHDLLTYVARCALKSGLGVVVVTRSETKAAVIDVLRDAIADRKSTLDELTIPVLDENEINLVVTEFPDLNAVAADSRSRWLLSRPGLADALLKHHAYAALPSGALSEADVFAAFWKKAVRRDEQGGADGSTPDGREAALLEVARRKLNLEGGRPPFEASALGSLRRDGILLSLGATSAWQPGDEFANDFIQDLAVAKLMVVLGPTTVLAKSNAPRWAIRASRMACQAKLLMAGNNIEAQRANLQKEFEELAQRDGARWAEVPWEAVLTLGASRAALEGAAETLLKRDSDALNSLLRVVNQRFPDAGYAELRVSTPVVEFLCDHFNRVETLPTDKRETILDFVASWLSALAIRGASDSTDPLRIRVRDEIILKQPFHYDTRLLRFLGVLGADLNEAAKTQIRRIALRYPHLLYLTVEEPVSALSLSVHHPDFLIEISEAYYFENSDRREDGYYLNDCGIRGHTALPAFPLAAWYRGPFWHLLRTQPEKGMSFINRLLIRAARYLVVTDRRLPEAIPLEELPGLKLDLGSRGISKYIGDSSCWSWYRGVAASTYPCASALLAVERFADQILRSNVPPSKFIDFLLKDCENLAVPGLVVGLLVRRCDRVDGQLDPWLSNAWVWQFEFDRAHRDRIDSSHVQGPDDKDTIGSDKRNWTFFTVSHCLIERARKETNQHRLNALHAAASTLALQANSDFVAAAGDESAEDQANTIRIWASALDPDNYHLEAVNGEQLIVHTSPRDVVEIRDRFTQEMQPNLVATHLIATYSAEDKDKWSRTLLRDIGRAKALPANLLTDETIDQPSCAIFSVAAAAIYCHANALLTIDTNDVDWAIDKLMIAARPGSDHLGADTAVFPWGRDRIAARSLPYAWLLARRANNTDRETAIIAAIKTLSTSESDEVRRTLAISFECIWMSSCFPRGTSCLHSDALQIMRESARHSRLGPFDRDTGTRAKIERIDGEFESAFASLDTRNIVISRLVPPIAAANACMRLAPCCVPEATKMCETLLNAHRRGRAYFAKRLYQVRREEDALIAEALLDLPSAHLLLAYIRTYAAQSSALHTLLFDLSAAATYDVTRRTRYRSLWDQVMDCALEQVEAGNDFRTDGFSGAPAFSNLIPFPRPKTGPGFSEVLQRALDGWPRASELLPQIDRWMAKARGAECVDSLVSLIKLDSRSDQETRGLDWVVRLATGHFDELAGRTFVLIEWLDNLSKNPLDPRTHIACRRIVDGLATAGDSRALALQKSFEHP